MAQIFGCAVSDILYNAVKSLTPISSIDDKYQELYSKKNLEIIQNYGFEKLTEEHISDAISDFDKALAEAKAAKKHVFVLFTGSDWCGWCIKLRKNVLDNKKFKKRFKKELPS